MIIELGQSISIEDRMSGLFATEPLKETAICQMHVRALTGIWETARFQMHVDRLTRIWNRIQTGI